MIRPKLEMPSQCRSKAEMGYLKWYVKLMLLLSQEQRLRFCHKWSKRVSRIVVPDFFFHPSIFFHVISCRPFGLDSPKSDWGGVSGGVIGSLLGLSALLESSVKESTSPVVVVVLLLARRPFPGFEAGVNRPVGSDSEKASRLELGDPLRFDLLRPVMPYFFSVELSESHLFRLAVSAAFDCPDLLFAFLDGGTSFKKGISTDSSIRL